MSDESTGAATEAAPEAAGEQAAATQGAQAAETYEPGKRSFAAHVQEHAARIDAAKESAAAGGEGAQAQTALDEKAQAEAKAKAAKQPNDRPPPNRLGGARKAFFAERQAKAEAAQAAAQTQTAEQRLATLEKEVAEARSGMDKARELFDKGEFDAALKLINARSVDSFEAMQKRYLAQLKDTPASDPRMEELKAELDAIKAERAAEKEAQMRAEEAERERLQTDSLYQAVCETTANSDNPNVRRYSGIEDFNKQVLQTMIQYPNATEEQVFNVLVEGWDQTTARLLAVRGFTEDQIQSILDGNVPGDAKTEAKAASPARPSVTVETAKAAKPSQHKPTVTISTNAAESTHAARKWDPKSRDKAWENAKRSYVPQQR